MCFTKLINDVNLVTIRGYIHVALYFPDLFLSGRNSAGLRLIPFGLGVLGNFNYGSPCRDIQMADLSRGTLASDLGDYWITLHLIG